MPAVVPRVRRLARAIRCDSADSSHLGRGSSLSDQRVYAANTHYTALISPNLIPFNTASYLLPHPNFLMTL